MKQGFICLHRKMLEWEWHDDPLMGWLWINLLLMASFNDTKYRGIELKRGQVYATLQELSQQTGLTSQQIRTRLTNLQKCGNLTKTSTNKYSIITICNYDSYQNLDCLVNKQLTNNQQTNNKQITNHIDKNVNNVNNTPPIIPPKGETKAKKKSMEERAKDFVETIKPYVGKYGSNMCNEFYLYWTEPLVDNPNKMRFEREKAWSVGRRLSTWKKHQIQYDTTNRNNNQAERNEQLLNQGADLIAQQLLANG